MENRFSVQFRKKEFNCERHGKVTCDAMIFADGTEVDGYCPQCAKERELQEQHKQELIKNEMKINRFKAHNIEPEFYFKTMNDYQPVTESQRKAKAIVAEMMEKKSGKVILIGSNGIGKSMLGNIAAQNLDGVIYTMYEISTMIRQSYTIKAEKSELEIVKELAAVPFLAIDELGRSKGSDAELNWLSYVLDKRHVRNLPTMIMGNLHLQSTCKDGGCDKCFERYLDNDILSRLRENSKFITVDGPDHRRGTNGRN